MFNLLWPKLSQLQIQITDQIKLRILIMNPDYGIGITDPGLRIWIENLDYGSGLMIWITDYGSGLWHKDQDKFGNDRLIMDQDLPHLYTDNFSRAIQPMTRDHGFWTKCALDEVLLPPIF